MIFNKKETAEQKLLKMIEASGGDAADGLSGAIAGGSSSSAKKAKKKFNLLLFIKFLNCIFLVSIVVAFVFMLGEFTRGMRLVNKKLNFSIPKKFVSATFNKSSIIPVVQRLSFYLSAVNKRNFFEPFQPEDTPTIEHYSKTLAFEQMVGKYKLVGISWMDSVDTASVMIEDTEKKTTYFLNKGEKIGDIIVKTIYAESALLGYEDEEIIIKYDKSQ